MYSIYKGTICLMHEIWREFNDASGFWTHLSKAISVSFLAESLK